MNMDMEINKFFILPLIMVLLVSGVSSNVKADSRDDFALFVGFEDGSLVSGRGESVTKTIDHIDVKEIKFAAQALHSKGLLVDVLILDEKNDEVSSFVKDQRFVGGDYSGEYTINKERYDPQNTGEGGKYRVYIYVREEGNINVRADRSWNLVVNPKPTEPAVNNPPQIEDIPDQEIEEGEDFSYQVVASDEGSLTYSIGGPEGMSISESGLITWNGVVEGIYTIKVSVSDNVNPAVLKSFLLTVSAATEPVEPQEPEGPIQGDFDKDGDVDLNDFLIFVAGGFGTSEGEEGYDASLDLDGSGIIDFNDFLIFLQHFGRESGLSIKFFDTENNEISEIGVEEGEPAYTFRVEAKDKDGNDLEFEVESELEAAKEMNVFVKVSTDHKSVIHPDVSKEHEVRVSASDEEGNVIEKVFKVKVEDVNQIPEIVKVEQIYPITTPKEGQIVKLEVGAEDGDEEDLDVLEYSVDGGNFVQGGNVLSWQTGFQDAGDYELVVSVEDGAGGKDSKEFSLKILDNEPIEFTSEPVTEFSLDYLGKEYRYDVNTNRDDRGFANYPVYFFLEIEDGEEVPEGMEIDRKTGVITWKPGLEDFGKYEIKVGARDEDGIEAFQEFTLNVVKPGNVAPSLVVKKEGVEMEERAKVNEGKELVLDLEVDDPDGNLYPGEVSVELEGAPEGMVIEDNQIRYTPSYDVVQHSDSEMKKEFEFEIVVSDGMDENRVEFEVVVWDVNRFPEWVIERIFPDEWVDFVGGENIREVLEDDAEIRIKEGKTAVKANIVELEVSNETDLDGDEIVVGLGLVTPDGMEIEEGELKGSVFDVDNFLWKIRKNQGTYRNSNPEGLEKPYQIVFKVSDGYGSEQGKIDVFVEDNYEPHYPELYGKETSPVAILSVLDMAELEGEDGKVRVLVSAQNSDDKQDWREELEFKYDWGDSGATEWGRDISGTNSRVEHIYDKDLGSAIVRLDIRDLDGNEVSDRKFLDLVNLEWSDVVNQPPEVNVAGETITKGESFRAVNLDNAVKDDSTPDDRIEWSIRSDKNYFEWSVDEVDGDRVATITYPGWVPAPYSETLTFFAVDEGKLIGKDSAEFKIEPAVEEDKKPKVGDIPGEIISLGGVFKTINLNTFVDDDETPVEEIEWSISSDGDQLSWSIEKGIVTISYPEGWTGKETLTFTATDGDGLSGSDEAEFAVVETMDPVLVVKRDGVAIGNELTINESESLVLVLEGFDPDGDSLRYEVLSKPSGASLVGDVFSWTPSKTQGGRDYTLTFRVLDLDEAGQLKGGSDSHVVVVTVNDNLEPLYREKRRVHHLELGNIIINNWGTVQKGEGFDIDVFVKNKGNVKQKDVRVKVEIPQLDYFERSAEFDIKKKKDERVGFSAYVPGDFDEELVFAIVTASNNKDKDTEVMGFLVE